MFQYLMYYSSLIINWWYSEGANFYKSIINSAVKKTKVSTLSNSDVIPFDALTKDIVDLGIPKGANPDGKPPEVELLTDMI